MSVLFPHVAFDHVETPLSFATRLANFHLRSTVVPFLHDLGIKPEALLGNEEPAIDRLAAVADVDASALGHVLTHLAAEEIDVEAAGTAGEALIVVVSRRSGPDAVRAVEAAVETAPARS